MYCTLTFLLALFTIYYVGLGIILAIDVQSNLSFVHSHASNFGNKTLYSSLN